MRELILVCEDGSKACSQPAEAEASLRQPDAAYLTRTPNQLERTMASKNSIGGTLTTSSEGRSPILARTPCKDCGAEAAPNAATQMHPNSLHATVRMLSGLPPVSLVRQLRAGPQELPERRSAAPPSLVRQLSGASPVRTNERTSNAADAPMTCHTTPSLVSQLGGVTEKTSENTCHLSLVSQLSGKDSLAWR